MMGRILGTALVLCAAGLTVWEHFASVARERAAITALISALEYIAGEIRWRRRRLPDIFRDLSRRPHLGRRFKRLGDMLESNIALHSAWKQVFCDWEPEAGEVILRADLTGDAEHIVKNLLGTAQELRELRQDRSRGRKEKDKTFLAVVCSGAAVLLILLL